MKPISAFVLNLCLFLCILGQKQETYLIEECVSKNYTQNSCEKVFCQPWQKCVQGSCLCKLPYKCPKNGTTVCTSSRKTFRTYCHLKSYECQHERSKFLHRGNCNTQDNFQIFLGPDNATSEGSIQVEITPFQKMFVCGNGWGMNEANVACRYLGFPEGADLLDLVDLDDGSHPLECLKATCRGIETSLAECTFTKQNWNNQKVAKVVCHTELKECSSGEFCCVNGKCIPSDKTCDGINDCGDLSDELCCKACRGETFHCMSDVCIPNKYLCNNEMDCLTGEDESHQLCANKAEENREEETETDKSMDEERKKIRTFLPQLHCGTAKHIHSRQKRIAGGITAGKDEFPWQVAIRGETERIICGGTYIGDCWILTAASCVRPAHLKEYKVFTGLLNSLMLNEEINAFDLKKVIVHEKYNSQTYENNIALLEMKDMRKCSPFGSVPACIPWSQYMFKGSQECKVSGYGHDENLTAQYRLKWGSVYLMGNCSEIYKERFHNGMECAGYKPFPRYGYKPQPPNGCGSPLFGVHFDIGIPSMTKCCNQHDRCYDTCGNKKHDCDEEFQYCLSKICRDVQKTLGIPESVQACESTVQLVFDAVIHLGCKPYLDSQRAACMCRYEDKRDL